MDKAAPNPMPLAAPPFVEHVDEVQRIYCRFRNYCLDIACKDNWLSFTCNQCEAYETLSPEEINEDTARLLELTAVVNSDVSAGGRKKS